MGCIFFPPRNTLSLAAVHLLDDLDPFPSLSPILPIGAKGRDLDLPIAQNSSSPDLQQIFEPESCGPYHYTSSNPFHLTDSLHGLWRGLGWGRGQESGDSIHVTGLRVQLDNYMAF